MAPPALALLAGCALGSVHHVDARAAAAAVCLAWVLAAVCWVQCETAAFVAAAVIGFGASGVALASQASWEATHTQLRAALVALRGPNAVGDSPLDPIEISGRLTEDATPADTGVRLALDVRAIHIDGVARPAAGGVFITVSGEVPPGKEDEWRRGRTVRLPALLRRPARYLNPGVPDQELALARRGITLVGLAKSALLVRVAAKGGMAAEISAELRARARRVFDQVVGSHSPRSSAIVRAVILGDRAGLDEETELRLQEAGTYHVLAISGGNIAILAGLLLGLGHLLSVRPGVSHVAVAAVLTAYAYLVGGGASVSRATMMAVVYFGAVAIDHRCRPLNVLAGAAAANAAAQPLVLFDTGAWLTYGATLAICLGVPVALARVPLHSRLGRALVGLFAASCAAEVALFPISALVFSRVTAAGLVLNFAAIPLMTVVQTSGMAILAAVAVAPAAAPFLGQAAHLSAWALAESARFVDLVPWITTRLAAPPMGVVVTYYAAWVVALAAGHAIARHAARSIRWGRVMAAAIVAIAGAGLWIVLTPMVRFARTDALEVTFLDVGQGDATLIRLPSGHTLLVDSGGAGGSRFDIGRRVIEPAMWARGAGGLSRLVLTHGDADHAGGAPSIVRDLRPPEVWEGVAVPPDALLQRIRADASARGAIWRTVQRGDTSLFGGVEVRVRHPPAAEWERQRIRNDDSVVLELRMGRVSIVLPGDIETSAEATLASELAPAPVRVLQAPHHGSLSSSTWPLLQAARPALAVISAGRGNRYGHPHRAVLERYRAMGARVMRTDLDGAVTVRTRGDTAEVTTYSGRRLLLGPATAGAVPRRP